MKTFKWNTRVLITVTIAFLLTASVGIMGVWLILSGQPGTGMMESVDQTGMMSDAEMADNPSSMMGVDANRGLFGGYTGTIGLVMIVAFVGMVAMLLYALFREKPGQPQPAFCWNCNRPVEITWATCPYCDAVQVEKQNELETTV